MLSSSKDVDIDFCLGIIKELYVTISSLSEFKNLPFLEELDNYELILSMASMNGGDLDDDYASIDDIRDKTVRHIKTAIKIISNFFVEPIASKYKRKLEAYIVTIQNSSI